MYLRCCKSGQGKSKTSQQSERSDICERLLTVGETFPPFEGITTQNTRHNKLQL